MQVKAVLKNLNIAPRKVRLVADLIRGEQVQKAKQQLNFLNKRAAKPMLKLLNSAIANAGHNHSIAEKDLVIKTIFVDKGRTLKRFTPRAFGRATMIRKFSSHVTLVLEGESKAPAKKSNAKVEKTSEDKKEKSSKKDVKKVSEKK